MKYLIALLFIVVLVTSCSLYLEPVIENSEENMSKSLVVYGWQDYFGNVSEFENKYNVSVTVYSFDSENEMVSQVQSSTAKYDVMIASDVIVAELNRMKLLSNIRKKNIPNLKYIDIKFLDNSYDADQNFSVPYLWGTTGIIANKKYIDSVDSWSILWNKNYSGKIGLLNDPDEIMAVALKYLGHSLTSTVPVERSNARDALVKQKYLVKSFEDSDKLHLKIEQEEIWVSQLFSRDAGRLRNKNSNLVYYVPNEGAALWVDNMVISRDSQNKYTAELFINYYLEPKVNAKIANNLWVATTNIGAKAYMNQEIINDKSIYLSPKVYNTCEMFLQKPYTTRFG